MHKLLRTYSLFVLLGTTVYPQVPVDLETLSTDEISSSKNAKATLSNAEITKIKAIAKAEAHKAKIIAKAIRDKNIIEAEAIQIEKRTDIEAKMIADINSTKIKAKLAQKEAVEDMKLQTKAATLSYEKTILKAETALQSILNEIEKKPLSKIKNKKSLKKNTKIQKLLNHLFKDKKLTFQKGKNILTKGSDSVMLSLIDILKKYPNLNIEIAGYTDSDGTKALNRKLSQDRVDTIKNILLLQDIKEERLHAKGYGEAHPIVPNSTEKNKSKNRRIEIHAL